MDPQDQQKEARYVILTEDILGHPELSSNDKIVLARATGFPEFYESAEETGKFLGMNERTVRRSKQKLLELGFLVEIRNTGHGKRYAVDLHRTLQKADNTTGQIVLSDRTNDTPSDKSGNLTGQNWSSNRTKLVTENKERLNGEESLSLKDKSFKEAQAPTDESGIEPLNEEQPKSYGKAEINDLLELWLEETGFDHKSAKAERYAINNLLRKNGYEATKALIRRVGRARRSDSQFAPQIAKPSQLQGKYSKLEALVIWEEREAKKQQAEIAAKPAGPIVPRFTPYEDAREGKTEEELRAECQAIRDKYKGTKFEKIFGGRK